MDQRGLFIASFLDSTSKALAAGAANRFLESEGSAEGWGFHQLVADTEVRIHHLAEALAAGRPDLFRLDVDWLTATYVARGVPTSVLEAQLRVLRAELAASLAEDAAEAAIATMDAALEGFPSSSPPVTSLLVDGEPHVELARTFLLAILEGRRADAITQVEAAHDRGVSIPDLHRHVIAKAMAEIGVMWQAGEIHVAEEHLSSRIVEDVLALLSRKLSRPEEGAPRVIVASVAGNLHDVGTRMVADQFRAAGWNAFFLGADVPCEDLVRAILDLEADLVALSLTLSLNVRACARQIEAIRADVERPIPILVGGRAFAALPGLWEAVGADGSAVDPSAAVREAERLLSA